ncbi:hypothetical protein DFS33DRAFT_1402133 [Desarmillaria ectypa]|nr:hypothetical protein DFS33DRAFT_1402133 [Desarmillaria ectypa]
MTPSKLFQPITVGEMSLQHRVVGAPLTRFRGSSTHVPNPVMCDYYEQRSHTPGTLLIGEATIIAAKAGGMVHIPGIWDQEQIDAWKSITQRVHTKACYIFCQLWAHGRAAYPEVLAAEDPSFPYIAPSDIPLTGQRAIPRPMTVEEIQEYVQLYATAAQNAMKAGFDGVEIHGANGYLLDQFTQDVSNRRSDQYGGNIVNRARFPLQVVDAVVNAIGAGKTGYRLSPWNSFQDMAMKDPKPTFAYLVSQIKEKHPDFAYIHVVEPRIVGTSDRNLDDISAYEENDFLREIWVPKPVISAGGYDQATAITVADEKNDLVAFGRHFLANPDLVCRLKNNIPLNPYDRETFYIGGNVAKGYTDYPFAAAAPEKAAL